ncbi:hypothetical protein DSLASN_10990 [Desulfoluna limicola]|uniref:Uncharacterized protein n=1 Tax=Desulfoluna limicola TaxID=2810562 RepID=A0ABN6F2D7_9BACT|nr:hypothetical protein [Desulfoluna limicola]BCS95467.1 hypothetical protein DSLASN_10990 [Desulfoluna limicola]
MNNKSKKFSNSWCTTHHFTKQIDIQCPQCLGHAISTGKSEYLLPWMPENTKVICTECSYTKSEGDFKWSGPVVAHGRRPCGHCGHKWVGALIFKNKPPKIFFDKTQVSCPKCLENTNVNVKWRIDIFNGRPVDPYCGERLWYIDNYKNNEIWGYNLDHLSYIKEFISSSLRERGEGAGKYSVASNLPKWMKLKKNRHDIVKIIDSLMKK